MTDHKITEAKSTDLKPDQANANKHDKRGTAMIESSMRQDGFRFAGTVDKNDRIIHGNNRHEVATDVGLDDVVILDADPSKQYYLRFNDLDLTDPDNPARLLAYQANRSAQLSITWNPEQIFEDVQAGIDVQRYFYDDEIADIIAEIAGGDSSDDGTKGPKPVTETEAEHQYNIEPGQVWELGSHELLVGDSDKDWASACLAWFKLYTGINPTLTESD
jgi:hypothetical protein